MQGFKYLRGSQTRWNLWHWQPRCRWVKFRQSCGTSRDRTCRRNVWVSTQLQCFFNNPSTFHSKILAVTSTVVRLIHWLVRLIVRGRKILILLLSAVFHFSFYISIRCFHPEKKNPCFSILCLTRDFIRQGHAREKRKVYRATHTRSQAIDRG